MDTPARSIPLRPGAAVAPLPTPVLAVPPRPPKPPDTVTPLTMKTSEPEKTAAPPPPPPLAKLKPSGGAVPLTPAKSAPITTEAPKTNEAPVAPPCPPETSPAAPFPPAPFVLALPEITSVLPVLGLKALVPPPSPLPAPPFPVRFGTPAPPSALQGAVAAGPQAALAAVKWPSAKQSEATIARADTPTIGVGQKPRAGNRKERLCSTTGAATVQVSIPIPQQIFAAHLRPAPTSAPHVDRSSHCADGVANPSIMGSIQGPDSFAKIVQNNALPRAEHVAASRDNGWLRNVESSVNGGWRERAPEKVRALHPIWWESANRTS